RDPDGRPFCSGRYQALPRSTHEERRRTAASAVFRRPSGCVRDPGLSIAEQGVRLFRTRRMAVASTMVWLAALTAVTAPPADARVPRFGHVFVVIGENTSYAQITPA